MAYDSVISRRTRRSTRLSMSLPALALVAAGALAPAACVSKARLVEVEQERDICTTRFEQLQSQVETAHKTGETLAQEKVVLANEKTVLEAKVATLQTQGEQLDSQLKERDEEARKLQETYDGLVANLKKE